MQTHCGGKWNSPHPQDFGRQVKVSRFDGTTSADATTVTGVLGCVYPSTGDNFMLVVHQAILVPKMTVNLFGIDATKGQWSAGE